MKRKIIITISIIIVIITMCTTGYASYCTVELENVENIGCIAVDLLIDNIYYEKKIVTDTAFINDIHGYLLELSKLKPCKVMRKPDHEQSYQKDSYISIRLQCRDNAQIIDIGYDKKVYFFIDNGGSDPGYIAVDGGENADRLINYIENLYE